MATIFLGCFIFGALFTAASFVLGFGGHSGPGLHHGGVPSGGHSAHVGHAPGADHELPLFNASSLLAFLTLFGGVGYILTRYADWVVLPALIGAVLAGLIGWLGIAMLLRTVLAGEVELDPADFRMEGTLGHVTSAIPPHGSGEILFSMGGTHRGEARAHGRWSAACARHRGGDYPLRARLRHGRAVGGLYGVERPRSRRSQAAAGAGCGRLIGGDQDSPPSPPRRGN